MGFNTEIKLYIKIMDNYTVVQPFFAPCPGIGKSEENMFNPTGILNLSRYS